MTTTAFDYQKVGGFTIAKLGTGMMFDDTWTEFPSKLHGYIGSEGTTETTYATSSSTTFVGIHEGSVYLHTEGHTWGPLTSGYYVSVVGEFSLSGEGSAVLFERMSFKGIFLLGGPIEETGRLKFIDGCTDTVVIYPPRMGDACMNVLYFPTYARQSMHTHPSIRYGLVVQGYGRCVTPCGELELKNGYVFRLEVDAEHCFHTDDQTMAIYSYHPDSNWGPTDEVHPMINRTTITK